MTEQTMASKQFHSLDEQTARAFLREGYIGRQTQAGNLSQDTINTIRLGKQDQSLSMDDALYALTNAEQVWPQVEQSLQQQQN